MVKRGQQTLLRQAGLSLVELMIALVLGIILVFAMTELFANVTRTNNEMAKTNSQIENARFAMQFLRNDIVHAGYWNAFIPEFDDLMYSAAPTDAPTLIPDPCAAFASWNNAYINSLIGIGIQAYNGSPSTACNAVVTDRLAGTDVLVVRHADTCVAGEANCDADIAGRLYFQPSNCETEIDAGSFYSLDPNSYLLTERDCVTQASKRRFIQHIYYVRDFASTAGDGIPTLVRSEFDLDSGTLAHQPAEPLVQGIERFRVELGIDSEGETGATLTLADYSDAVNWQDPANWTVPLNRGDGIPDDGFVHCTTSGAAPCQLLDLINVVAVKIYLLARADEASPGYTDTKTYTLGGLNVAAFNDGFKRHVFTNTIRINNVAGRRETP